MKLLIGGELVEGDGEPLAVEEPARAETFDRCRSPPPSRSTRRSRPRAAGARLGATPAGERAELLHEVARRIREKTDALAETMTREGGKPRIENVDEVGWTAAAFDYYAEMGRNFAGRVIPPIEASQLALVLKEPMGVVACIVPWNYPLLLLAWKLAPALAAGNACVCKPSELTPLSTLVLADCFSDLPPGAVNLLCGAGDVGARIVADERVDCVAFTGSVETGKRIAHTCVDRVARINLELGGKDPFIVCADVAADIEVAAKRRRLGGLPERRPGLHFGRALLRRAPVYDDFVAAFVEHAQSLRLGDPLDDSTDIGPMVSEAQRGKVEAQLEAAVGAGAEVLHGGDHGGQERGWFMAPTVVTGAAAETALLPRRPSARSRRSCASTRSTRRSSSPTRRASGSAPTSTRATSSRSSVACASSRRAPSGSTTR